MRGISLLIALVFLFSLEIGVLAQEIELPNPGLTPDSPFYFLDTLGEKIGMLFTFGSEKKAEKALQFAEEKIAEVEAMAEKNKIEALEKANQNYQKYLGLANEKVKEAGIKGKDVERLVNLIKEKTSKHQEILSGVLEKVPEQAKSGIEKAIEMSKKGYQTAIEAVSKIKEEKEKVGETKMPEMPAAQKRELITPRWIIMKCQQISAEDLKKIFGYNFTAQRDTYAGSDDVCGSPWKIEDEEAAKVGISGIVEMTIRDKERDPQYDAKRNCEISIKKYSGKSAGIEDVSCVFPYGDVSPYGERYDLIFERNNYYVSFICAGAFCSLEKLIEIAKIADKKFVTMAGKTQEEIIQEYSIPIPVVEKRAVKAEISDPWIYRWDSERSEGVIGVSQLKIENIGNVSIKQGEISAEVIIMKGEKEMIRDLKGLFVGLIVKEARAVNFSYPTTLKIKEKGEYKIMINLKWKGEVIGNLTKIVNIE